MRGILQKPSAALSDHPHRVPQGKSVLLRVSMRFENSFFYLGMLLLQGELFEGADSDSDALL